MKLHNGAELQGGKYRIISVLGQGGFGITYLAEQVSLGRKVAIKEFFMKDLCNRECDNRRVSVGSVGSCDLVERFRQKFLKEARVIATFSNAHIISIYDVFEENGTAYYVMEFLEGNSLAGLLKEQGALSETVAVKYISQVADALAEIHSRNLLHLDVKPVNIMLNRRDNAVLIDFGISKHYDEEGGQTSSGLVGLSDGYAPVEQYKKGGISSFSPATDIYSLGATLYKLLTGNTPPHASDVLFDGLPELPQSISAPVRDVIETAMRPNRKERYQSVEELLTGLSHVSLQEVKHEMKQEVRPDVVEVDDDETILNETPELIPLLDAKTRKYGYADKSGNEVIPCRYDDAWRFSEGLAKVKLNDKWGFVDKSGNEVVPCKYDYVRWFSEGLARVELAGKWGFIDKSGNEVIPCKYDITGSFSEGLAEVKFAGKCGFIDKVDNMVIPCRYDSVGKFSEGLARVELAGKWGFIDKSGNEVIPCKYDITGSFSEGLAEVKFAGKCGFIDKVGNMVIPCKYDSVGKFFEGLAAVKLAGKCGFVDKGGNEVIPCKYDYVRWFSEGLAEVGLNGKWGFIDKSGKEVIPCEYDNVSWFSEGLAGVKLKLTGKCGFIDKSGNEVVSCKYDHASFFSENIARVRKDKMEFYIDKTGKEYIKIE